MKNGSMISTFLFLAPGSPDFVNLFLIPWDVKTLKEIILEIILNYSEGGSLLHVPTQFSVVSFLFVKQLTMKGCLYQWERDNLGENFQ